MTWGQAVSGKPTIPESYVNQDWPRKVKAAFEHSERRIASLESGGGSGVLSLDDGTATGGGGFSFDEGGA